MFTTPSKLNITLYSFGRSSRSVRSCPIVCCMQGLGILTRPCLLLLPIWMWSLYLLLWREGAVQLIFRVFSAGIIPGAAIDFLCPWEGEFRVFLCYHLDYIQLCFAYICKRFLLDIRLLLLIIFFQYLNTSSTTFWPLLFLMRSYLLS